MADQVRIKKADRELTVSLKAFQTIYRAKGFAILGDPAAVAAVISDGNGETEEVAAAPSPKSKSTRRPSKRRLAKKSDAPAVEPEAPEEG